MGCSHFALSIAFPFPAPFFQQPDQLLLFPVVKPRQRSVQFFGMVRYNNFELNDIKIEKNA
jgi:hypothetical protein